MFLLGKWNTILYLFSEISNANNRCVSVCVGVCVCVCYVRSPKIYPESSKRISQKRSEVTHDPKVAFAELFSL